MNKKIFVLFAMMFSFLIPISNVLADTPPIIGNWKYGDYDLLMRFIPCFFITIILETIVIFFMIRKVFKINDGEHKNSNLFFAGIFTSFSTLPYLFFLFPMLLTYGNFYNLNIVVIGEILVFLIEIFIYYFLLKISVKRAIAVSFFCNIISFVIGTLLMGLL